MSAGRTLRITILGDDKSGSKVFGALEKSSGGFFSSFGKGALSMAAGLGVFNIAQSALGGLKGAIGDAIGAAKQQQQVDAQTEAVIKSTGGAAGVSAQQIQDYANAIQDSSTFGNEAVQQGENMLLTFTNIGKDVFPTATQTLTDMTAAMNASGKSTSMSDMAVQLGKALNDPIAGISALSRVGVTFTQEQKDQIKVMQDAGDTAARKESS